MALKRWLYTPEVSIDPRATLPDHIARIGRIMDAIDDGPLLAELSREGKPGRNGYEAQAMWRAYCAGLLLEARDIADLVRRLRNDPALAHWCGFGTKLPHRTTILRFISRLSHHDALLQRALAGLVDEVHARMPEYGTEVAVDSTGVIAHANPRRRPFADPDARLGYKTSNRTTGRTEYFLGYRGHFAVCAITELPLAWKMTPANESDSPELPVLLDDARRRHPWLRPRVVSADRGYDSRENANYVLGIGAIPVIPARDDIGDTHGMLHDGTPRCACGSVMTFGGFTDKLEHRWLCPHGGVMRNGLRVCMPSMVLDWRDNPRRTPPIPRSTDAFWRLYGRRGAVERFNSVIKDSGRLGRQRHRGQRKLNLLMTMIMLLRLAIAVDTLNRGRRSDVRKFRTAVP